MTCKLIFKDDYETTRWGESTLTVQLLGALKNIAKVCHVFPPPCQPVGDVVIVSRSDRQAVVVHNCQAIRDA